MVPLIVGAQNTDSLGYLLSKATSDKKKLELSIKLSLAYKDHDEEKSRHYAEDAVKIAQRLGDLTKLGASYSIVAVSYVKQNKNQEALGNWIKSLEAFEAAKDSISMAKIYVALGECYRKLSQPGNAVKNNLKALDIYENKKAYKEIGTIYNNMGIIYNSSGEYDKAIKNYKKALEYEKEYNNRPLFLSKIYNNLGNVYIALKENDTALQYHLKALSIREDVNKPYFIIGSLLNIGGIYSAKKDFWQALDYFNKVIEKGEKINDDYTLSLAHHNKGQVLANLGRRKEAIAELLKALELGKEQGNLSLISATYAALSLNYEKLGDQDKALSYLKLNEQVKDSLVKINKEQELAELQTRYETEQKEKEIELLQKDKEISRLWRNVLIAGIFLALAIGILIFTLLRIRIKKNKQLYEKEQELTKARLEKTLLKEQQLENEIDIKSKQLTTHTLNMIQKNKLLEELQLKVKELKKPDGPLQKKLTQLSRFINYSLNVDKDWEEFQLYFERVNQDFYKHLKEEHHDLTPAEMRLAALIKLKMTIKEVSAVLNISPGSVKTARYRLRKKFNLQTTEDLSDYLMKF